MTMPMGHMYILRAAWIHRKTLLHEPSMQGIAAGEHARDIGHELTVADGSLRVPIERNADALGKLIFGDKADRDYECIALDSPFGALYGLEVFVNFGYLDRFQSVSTEHSCDGVA